ncbi:hypothetical protein [Acetivibrio saccincola]|uniref:hypothetical protein n=1 Tax=Acetivibrio saccincola TaxID=1677857 RepID=UPI0023527E57|nr:hypothetical protein [Acetivibrio saccincola]
MSHNNHGTDDVVNEATKKPMDSIKPPIITVILGPILFCSVPPMVPPMPSKANRSENVSAASAFDPPNILEAIPFWNTLQIYAVPRHNWIAIAAITGIMRLYFCFIYFSPP